VISKEGLSIIHLTPPNIRYHVANADFFVLTMIVAGTALAGGIEVASQTTAEILPFS
jgi:hypothetical protein